MGLNFHPLVGPVDFSDLFLTCSVDWTVKLWRAKSLTNASGPPPPSLSTNLSSSTSGKSAGAAGSHASAVAPIYSFEEADDYVYDVKWHPLHPAMFGTVDGSGKFDLWNLNTDTEVRFRSGTFYFVVLTRCSGSRRIYHRQLWPSHQQDAMGQERRTACRSRGKRWEAVYLRYRRRRCPTGVGVDGYAENHRWARWGWSGRTWRGRQRSEGHGRSVDRRIVCSFHVFIRLVGVKDRQEDQYRVGGWGKRP